MDAYQAEAIGLEELKRRASRCCGRSRQLLGSRPSSSEAPGRAGGGGGLGRPDGVLRAGPIAARRGDNSERQTDLAAGHRTGNRG